MIYISTGGFGEKSAYETTLDFIEEGISGVELSGGIYNAEMKTKLLSLQSSVSFQVHNYFPPPEKPFVLNLATPNQEIASISVDHVKKAIRCSAELGQSLYSFHAGFLMDPKVEELGKKVQPRSLFSREECLLRFIERINLVDEYAQSLGVKILVENNVLSAKNYSEFKANPFLMATADECIYVMRETSKNVQLLVDVAHLKVSAKSLGFNPIDFLTSCDEWIAAYHLSDNDGTRDSNEPINANSWFWTYLRRDLSYYSLEIYGISPPELVKQRDLVKSILTGPNL
jgi:sugar phosphate isomerase/epimerase